MQPNIPAESNYVRCTVNIVCSSLTAFLSDCIVIIGLVHVSMHVCKYLACVCERMCLCMCVCVCVILELGPGGHL